MTSTNDQPGPWQPPVETWPSGVAAPVPDPSGEDPYFPDPYAQM